MLYWWFGIQIKTIQNELQFSKKQIKVKTITLLVATSDTKLGSFIRDKKIIDVIEFELQQKCCRLIYNGNKTGLHPSSLITYALTRAQLTFRINPLMQPLQQEWMW